MEKPRCKLIGEDGNIFNIVGKVAKTLKDNGQRDKAEKMKERVFQSKSYDEALVIIMEYVEVE